MYRTEYGDGGGADDDCLVVDENPDGEGDHHPNNVNIRGMPLPSFEFVHSSPSSSSPQGSPTDDNNSLARGNSGFLPSRQHQPEVIDLTYSPAKPTTPQVQSRPRMQLPLPRLQSPTFLDPQSVNAKDKDADRRKRELASIFDYQSLFEDEPYKKAEDVDEPKSPAVVVEQQDPPQPRHHRHHPDLQSTTTSSTTTRTQNPRVDDDLTWEFKPPAPSRSTITELDESFERLDALQRMEEATEAAGFYIPSFTSSSSGFRPQGENHDLETSSDDDDVGAHSHSYVSTSLARTHNSVVPMLHDSGDEDESSSSSSEDEISDSDSEITGSAVTQLRSSFNANRTPNPAHVLSALEALRSATSSAAAPNPASRNTRGLSHSGGSASIRSAAEGVNYSWASMRGSRWPTRAAMTEDEQIALAIAQSLRDSANHNDQQESAPVRASENLQIPNDPAVRRMEEEGSEVEGRRERHTDTTANEAVVAPMDDEAFALALQRQFEEEASNAVLSRIQEQPRSRALRRTNVDISAFLGYAPGSHFSISSHSLGSSGTSTRSRSGWREHARSSRLSRIDPDRMSYEELLELGERLGDVKKSGASASAIRNNTQVYNYKQVANNEAHSRCYVCLCDFEEGEEVRMLPCIHAYHKDCIDKWLSQKDNCPVCKRSVTERNAS